MKSFLTLTCFLVAFLQGSLTVCAQTYNATWNSYAGGCTDVFNSITAVPNITISQWTRGANGCTSNSSGFSTTGFSQTSLAGAVSANHYAQATLTASNGVSFQLNSFFWSFYKSGTGPTAASLQYSVNNGPFVAFGSLSGLSSGATYNVVCNPVAVVPPNGNIRIRVYAWGAGSSGTMRIVGGSYAQIAIVAPSCTPSSTPDLSFNGNLTACSPNTVDLTGAAIVDANNTTGSYTYFSNPQVTIPVPNPSAVSTGTYYVVKTTTTGSCKDTVAIPVVIDPLPDATITLQQTTVCENASPFNVNVLNAGGTFSGIGITDPLNGTFDPVVSGPGIFPVIHEITQNGCTGRDTMDFTVDPMPDATILTADTTFCAGGNTFSVQVINPGGLFSGTGITDVNTGLFDPAVSGTGVFQIVYQVIQGQCHQEDTISVTVLTNPDASVLTPDTTVCESGGVFSIQVLTPGGVFSGTGITNPSTGSFDPALSSSGTFPVIYQFTLGACSDADTIDVIVEPSVDATILTPDTAVCGGTGTFSVQVLNPGGLFSGTGVTDVNTGLFDPLVSGPGVFPVVYSVSQGVCAGTDTVLITVQTILNASVLTPDTTVCESGNAFTLLTVSSGGLFSGTGITNVNTGLFDPAVAGAGTHTLVYQLTQNGCSDADTVLVSVTANPQVSITNPGQLCINGTSVTLTASLPGGTWSGTGITNVNTGTFNPAVAGIGTHTIQYQVTQNGCSGSGQTSVVVAASPAISISNPGNLCTGFNPVQLTAIPSGGTWSGNFINTGGIFNPSSSGPGSFWVAYQVTQNGCSDLDSLLLQVSATALVTILEPDDSVCITETPFTPSASPGGGTWTGTGIINGNLLDPSTLNSGSHSIVYNTISNNCPATATWNFEVIDAPNASFTVGVTGFQASVSAQIIPGQTYSWNFGDGQTGTGTSLDHTYQQAGNYTITLIVTNHCGSDTAVRPVTITTTGLGSTPENTILVGPNPTSGPIFIETEQAGFARLVSLTGETLWEGEIQAGNTSDLTLANYPAGMYLLMIQQEQTVQTFRLIKE